MFATLQPRLSAVLAALALLVSAGLTGGAATAVAAGPVTTSTVSTTPTPVTPVTPGPVGTYTVVSCTAPDGSAAPTDGWKAGTYGVLANAVGSTTADTCATGGDLFATSSSAGTPEIASGPEWTFTAPAGATIAGGYIDAAFTAPQGQAWLATPLGTNDAGDTLGGCTVNLPCGSSGSVSGVYPIDHPGGTSIYAPAICVDPGQAACPAGGGVNGVNAQLVIHQAEIELDTIAVPAASDLSGSLLAGKASGQANLSLQATDPMTAGGSGPGVYTVTVSIDGSTIYSGTPNTNGGKCVALGADPTDDAPIFGYLQPCRASERVTVPIDTTTLPDGSHTLSVTVADAAGDVSHARTTTFTTANTVTTPAPTSSREVTGQFVLGWRWEPTTTTLVSAGVRGLPAGGSVAVQCNGPSCPALRPARVPVARVATLLATLRHATYHAGDRVYLTIAPPPPPPVHRSRHRHVTRAPVPDSEHLRLTIKRDAIPTAKLVGSVPSAD